MPTRMVSHGFKVVRTDFVNPQLHGKKTSGVKLSAGRPPSPDPGLARAHRGEDRPQQRLALAVGFRELISKENNV